MAEQVKVGQASDQGLFARRASGLTRSVSPWSALVYAFVCPTMTFAFLYYFQEQTAYVGAHGWLTSLAVILLMPIALIYVFMSLSMPRSGGEYIYVSRILHPLLGFIASWTLTIVGINWSGLLSQWAVNWGLGNLFLAEGLATKNQTLVNWGKYLSITTTDSRLVIWLIASAILVSAFVVMALGTQVVMKAMWFVLVSQWVMLVTFILVALFSGGQSHALSGFEKIQGIKWTEVTDAVKSISGGAGLPGYAVAATLWAGLVWVNLSTLGSTYAANISGEIKKVNKAMPLSQVGAMVLFLVYWLVFTRAADHGLGADTIRSLAYIDTQGKATDLVHTLPTVSYMVVWMTQNWLLVAIAGPLGFFIATWGGILGLSFGPTRNMFAFSFDGLLPGWMNKVSPNGSPSRSVFVAFLIAWVIMTVSIFTQWWSFITYTVTIWMVGWVILGIAATVFPYVRKEIFEKSPAIVQSRIAGIPWITILGLLGTAVAALSFYATFLVGTTPTFNTKNLAWTSTIFIVAPIVIYFIATLWQRSKGVEMDKRFKEIPPE